jgi:hypothetical protein
MFGPIEAWGVMRFWHSKDSIHLEVEDVWHLDSFCKTTKKAFMFDNGCREAQVALLHIDYFYVSTGLDKRGGHTEIAALLRLISDH